MYTINRPSPHIIKGNTVYYLYGSYPSYTSARSMATRHRKRNRSSYHIFPYYTHGGTAYALYLSRAAVRFA